MFNEEHRRLIRAGLGILARALEPAHPPSHESSPRLADVEPTRLGPPASPVVAAPVQPVQAAPAQPEPVTPEPITPSPITEPQYPVAANRFFRGLPWSVSPVAEARPAPPQASEPAPSPALPTMAQPIPESPADSPQAAAGGYFQAVFRRQTEDATPARPVQPDRTERPVSAAGYFSGLPWRPVAPQSLPESAPPLGLSAAIMRAATRSALQSAERLAETQGQPHSPVTAASYFQSLPWRSRTAADGTHP